MHHFLNAKVGMVLIFLFLFYFIKDRSTGTITLSRYNVQSSSYYYGVVRVWDNGWGNICDDYYYNSAEANVICHQLGYTGASSYSRAGLTRYEYQLSNLIM